VSVSKLGYTGLDSSSFDSVNVNTNNMKLKLYINDGKISGVAQDSAGTVKMGGQIVTIAQVGGASYTVNTVVNGTFSMTNLPPKETGYWYTVTIDGKPGYTVTPDSYLVKTDTANLVFRYIPNRGTIKGRVWDDTAGVVAGAIVVVDDYNNNFINAVTDSTGRFSVDSLAPGANFRVSVSKLGYTGLDSSSFDNVNVNTNNMKFKLYVNDGIVSGFAYQDSTKTTGMAGQTVTIQQIGGPSYTLTTLANGSFGKTNLPPQQTGYWYKVTISGLNGYTVKPDSYLVKADTTGLSFVYKVFSYVLKVRAVYDYDTTVPVVNARVKLQNKIKIADMTLITNAAGLAVFSGWSYLAMGDTFVIEAEKYGETPQSIIDNFVLNNQSETTTVTIILKKSAITSIEIQIDQDLHDNLWIDNSKTHLCEGIAHSANGDLHLDPQVTTWSHAPLIYTGGAGIDFNGTLHGYQSQGNFVADFKPDSTAIGQDVIRLSTVVNGQPMSAPPKTIKVYAPLSPNTMPGPSITLRQYKGIKLTVNKTDLPAAGKGFYVIRDVVSEVMSSTAKYKVKGFAYKLSFLSITGSLSESNQESDLLDSLDIYLPTPSDVAANEHIDIGMWSYALVAWNKLPVHARASDFISTKFKQTESGEFAVVVSSGKLSLNDVELTPNPFSPQVREMQIYFKVDSKETREPLVTAIVRSVTGTMIRTICFDQAVNKGKEVHLIWDGRNDRGTMCRNGRYMLELILEDPSGTERVYQPIIMVK
jgi:hypothetical protein